MSDGSFGIQTMLLIADGAALALRTAIEAAGGRCTGPIAIPEGAAALGAGTAPVLIDLRTAGEDMAVAVLDALDTARRGLLIVTLPQADLVGALAVEGRIEVLADPELFELARPLRLALQPGASRLHAEADAARAARLRQIGEEMDRLARALAELADEQPARPALLASPPRGYRGSPAAAVNASKIRALVRARRQRDQYFDAGLFADPAWDMLLDLAAARLEGRSVSVSSLCIAAAVPATTALRWIKALAEAGLIVRTADRGDRRRVFIALSDDAAERMMACLAAILQTGSLPI